MSRGLEGSFVLSDKVGMFFTEWGGRERTSERSKCRCEWRVDCFNLNDDEGEVDNDCEVGLGLSSD